MRKFEKIPYEQFVKDVGQEKDLYNSYPLPKRATSKAAAYDFYALFDFSLKPGEIKKIPTGLRVIMEDDDALLLMVRSKMGFKYNVRLCNQIGLIDADYYNNSDNTGHMWIKLQNEGAEEFLVKKGEGICQGMFVKFLKTDDDIMQNVDRKSEY